MSGVLAAADLSSGSEAVLASAEVPALGSKAKSSHWTRLGRSVVGLRYNAELPLLVVPEAAHL